MAAVGSGSGASIGSGPSDESVVIRSGLVLVSVEALSGALVGFVPFAVLVLMSSSFAPVGFGFVAAGALYAGWRGARMHVRVSDEGLAIRNLWTSHELSWESITRLRMGRTPSGPMAVPVVRVETRDASVPIRVSAYLFWRRTRFTEAITSAAEEHGVSVEFTRDDLFT